ncbi:hypothetical protein [Mesorhizobium sp. IMUNJ 23033]
MIDGMAENGCLKRVVERNPVNVGARGRKSMPLLTVLAIDSVYN